MKVCYLKQSFFPVCDGCSIDTLILHFCPLQSGAVKMAPYLSLKVGQMEKIFSILIILFTSTCNSKIKCYITEVSITCTFTMHEVESDILNLNTSISVFCISNSQPEI